MTNTNDTGVQVKSLDVSEARLQDGTIKDATDFWQLIMDTGYIMEGENRQFERRQLAWLNECLDKWFEQHREITQDAKPLESFAMCAVARLVGAFAFNDKIGSGEPGFRERSFEAVVNEFGLQGARLMPLDES